MSGYVNNNADLNTDDFLSLFKRLYYLIKDKFCQYTKEELSFEELVVMYSNDKNFLANLNYIKSLLEDINEIMEDINFTYDIIIFHL